VYCGSGFWHLNEVFLFFFSSTFLFFLYHGLLQASKGLLSSSSSLHDGLSVSPVSFFSVLL
jgi:hypothetical protein